MASEYYPSFIGVLSTDSTRPSNLKNFKGHDAWIEAVGYSPDGKQIATGGRDPWIRIWDSNTGEIMFELRESSFLSSAIISLCYSPDGKQLVSGDDDGTICIRSAGNGKIILECAKAHSGPTMIAYSPRGRHIASGGSEGRVRIWRAENMTQLIEFPEHPDEVTSVSFSPDGQRLATGCGDSKVRIFDVMTGALAVAPLEGHTDRVWAVTYSPHGTQLASCSHDHTIRIWDASTGAMLLSPLEGHFAEVYCLVYSPDGKHLLSGSRDKTIRLWNSNTGEHIGRPARGHDCAVAAVSFAPDGTRFITGSELGSMRLWDARTQEIVSPQLTEDEKEKYQLAGPFRGHTGAIRAFAYFRDDDRVASASDDGSIRIWNVRTGEEIVRLLIGHDNWIHSIAISSDGSKLVSGGKNISVWDTSSGDVVLGPLKGHSNTVSCVQFSPDDLFIASSDMTGRLLLWDSQTATVLGSVKGHDGWVRALSFSADGSRLASGGNDKSISVWAVSTMELVAGPFKGHTDRIRSVAFSPNSLHIVSGSDDGTVRIWDAKTGTLILGSLRSPSNPRRAYSDKVTSVAYSPDGTKICSTSFDGTISMWHAMTGDLIFGPLRGSKGAILSAVFSSDGGHIVTGSDDSVPIKFWDTATGNMMKFPIVPHLTRRCHQSDNMCSLELLDRPLDLTEDIRRLDDHCCAGGSFGDIHKCLYDGPLGTFEIAVKALRFSMASGKDVDKSEVGILTKPVHRELGIWRRLDHQNIVPFLGIATGFGPYVSLVSMWMPNGTLHTFLENYDDRLSVQGRFRLLQDIIFGLEYLHSRSVVHGDLTPSNILIDDVFRARLTDFGFSSAIGNLPDCLAYLQRSTQRPGAIRWAAPEKLLEESHSMSQLTTKSDIYSFGCIMLQVLSGQEPWSGNNDMMTLRRIFDGQNPPRPLSRPIDDQHWAIIEQCLLPVSVRPSTADVVSRITSVTSVFERVVKRRLQDSRTGSSSSQDTARSKRSGDSGDYERRNKKSRFNSKVGMQLVEDR